MLIISLDQGNYKRAADHASWLPDTITASAGNAEAVIKAIRWLFFTQ